MLLDEMTGRAQGLYQFLIMNYGCKGYITQDEYNQVEQIRQVGQYLQTQKTQADQDLWNEMMKHLAKMAIKRKMSSGFTRRHSRDGLERTYAQPHRAKIYLILI